MSKLQKNVVVAYGKYLTFNYLYNLSISISSKT